MDKGQETRNIEGYMTDEQFKRYNDILKEIRENLTLNDQQKLIEDIAPSLGKKVIKDKQSYYYLKWNPKSNYSFQELYSLVNPYLQSQIIGREVCLEDFAMLFTGEQISTVDFIQSSELLLKNNSTARFFWTGSPTLFVAIFNKLFEEKHLLDVQNKLMSLAILIPPIEYAFPDDIEKDQILDERKMIEGLIKNDLQSISDYVIYELSQELIPTTPKYRAHKIHNIYGKDKIYGDSILKLLSQIPEGKS